MTVRLLGEFVVEVDDWLVPASAWNRRSAASLVNLLSLAPGQHINRADDAWDVTTDGELVHRYQPE